MMDRRSFLTGSGVLPALLAGSGHLFAAGRSQRPNVVLILADDLGSGDLSSYGSSDTRTPHIDSIGARGVKFTQCYANAPECTPTRSALMTGQYQQRFGGLECAIGIGNVGRYDEAIWLQQRGELGLPAAVPTMPRLLKNHGYDTALIGKWHLGYLKKFWPNRHGFDEFFGILGGGADYFTHKEDSNLRCFYQNYTPIEREGYMTDLLATEAVRWLKCRSRNPFFLYLAFTAPHLPAEGPGDEGKPEDKSGNAHETYIKMVERLDHGVGAVLQQLDRMGAAENTLLIFTSDNGAIPIGRNTPLRGYKSSVWEGGIRMPCMVRWPTDLKGGQMTTQVALSMDWLPTILRAVGAPSLAGHRFDGVNLLPILKGEQPPFARTVFWRYKRGENRRKAVRSGNMKYVCDNQHEELHDLAEDIREEKDLLARKPETAAELKKKLAAWEKQVQAPRLAGFPGG